MRLLAKFFALLYKAYLCCLKFLTKFNFKFIFWSTTSQVFALLYKAYLCCLKFQQNLNPQVWYIGQARLWACGRGDVSTPSYGSHLNPISTRGEGGRLCPTYTGVHNKFWKPQARLYRVIGCTHLQAAKKENKPWLGK